MRQVIQGRPLERLAADRTTPENHPPALPELPDEEELPEPEPELALPPDPFEDEDEDEGEGEDDGEESDLLEEFDDEPPELSLSALAAFL